MTAIVGRHHNRHKPFLFPTPGQQLHIPFIDFATTRNEALKAHGSRTWLSFMPDADFQFTQLWRLRLAASRLERECRSWSAVECGNGVGIFRTQGGVSFHMQVAFPSQGKS